MRHSTVYAAGLYTEKLILLNKRCFYRNNVRCQKLQLTRLRNAVLTQAHSFNALSIIRCLKSAHKLAIWVCHVATVVFKPRS